MANIYINYGQLINLAENLVMAFIKRILVPTDFSDPAKNALNYALTLAKMTDASIDLLHVYNVPVVDPYMPSDTMDVLMKEVRESAEKSMKDLLESTRYGNIKGECVLGFVTDDVAQYADNNEMDLIVMGTTGASGLKEVFFGSNASGLMSKAHIKVLAVPSDYDVSHKPKRICYASDFTGNEELRCLIFADLAKALDCDLDILHVVSDEPVYTQEPADRLFAQLQQKIDYDRMKFEEINSNDVTSAIETYVQTTGADILGMALHRRNLFERLFHKSKTKEIAHHAKIPLLSLHKD